MLIAQVTNRFPPVPHTFSPQKNNSFFKGEEKNPIVLEDKNICPDRKFTHKLCIPHNSGSFFYRLLENSFPVWLQKINNNFEKIFQDAPNCTAWYYSHFSSTLYPDPHIQNPDSLIFKTWMKLHCCLLHLPSHKDIAWSQWNHIKASMALSQREIPTSSQIQALMHDKP